MDFVTRDGLIVEVGRVDRRLLDRINITEPAPPTKQVETWGGVIESVPNVNDLGYQRELLDFRLRLWREQLTVLSQAITPPDDDGAKAQFEALTNVVGNIVDYKAGFLRYCLNDADRAAIVEEILYQSTVTQRGIDEATLRFGYTWRDKPLQTWHISMSYGVRGKLAVEWRAAIRSGYTWGQFCDLSGPEQSAHVAFWSLEDKLTGLLTQ